MAEWLSKSALLADGFFERREEVGHVCIAQVHLSIKKQRKKLEFRKLVPFAGIRVFSSFSRIERKHCLISTSYLTGLFDILILLHI